MPFKTLLSPIRIGSMEVKNRFVVPPMGTCFANPDATVSQRMIDYYSTRAKGGFGLITIEVTAVAPEGEAIKTEPGLWDDKFIPQYRKLIDACHKYGAKVSVQLHHAGRQTNTGIMGEQPVSSSPLPCPICAEVPRELTTEEVYTQIQNFIDAAQRAREAGADAVEVHGAHGYLVAQFMSPYSNKRTDEFGGTFINRMRFPALIIKGIREQVDANFPIIFRISGDEKITGGRTIAETRAIARLLEELGVNAMHVTASVYGSSQWLWAPTEIKAGYLAELSGEVKKSVSIPVITVGRYTDPFIAEDVLLTGKADMVSFGRESIADPEMPNKVAGGNLEEIAPCIACHQGCARNIFDGEPLTCLVNPFAGKEGTRKMEPASKAKRIMVVGGGPGGLEAAWIMAKRGHQVSLYEKQGVLGGQFRIGAIAPGKGELTAPIAYYRHMCEKYGAAIHLNTEVTAELVKAEKPDAVVLATGGKPLVPNIPGIDNPKYAHAVDVLQGKIEMGKKVLIVGGGSVGVEVTDFLSQYGRRVTIVEMKDEIMEDMHYVHKVGISERLDKNKAEIITGAKVRKFSGNTVLIEKDGKETELTGFDNIILAMGVVPYNPLEKQLKGMVPELYTIGDASKARDALAATEEASSLAVGI